MDRRQIAYWLTTGLFCVAMATGGTMNLLRVEPQQEAMEVLGYPDYLMTILGVAKVLGVIAIMSPGLPLLKEWAYAGFTFDLLGASASHAFVGDSLADIATPLVVLAVAITSYWLRPTTRRLQVARESSEHSTNKST